MQQRTDLSAGQINGNDHLRVELIGPGDEPSFVAITWPPPTVFTTATYDEGAASAMQLLAAASTAFAQLKARRQR